MKRQTKQKLIGSALAAGFLFSSASVFAGEYLDCNAPTQWTIRVGGHNVDPSATSHTSLGNIDVSSKFGATYNLDYRFCRNLAVDLLGALYYTHDISLNGTNIGTTQHLPPTLSLQYHFEPDGKFDPYIGIGVNYTHFQNTSLNIAPVGLKLDNTFGVAGQIGVDYHFYGPWLLGVDVRYLQIEPDASVGGQKIGTVNIDPIVYGFNIGYQF